MRLSADGMQVEAWLKRPTTKSKAPLFLGGRFLTPSETFEQAFGSKQRYAGDIMWLRLGKINDSEVSSPW